LFGRRAFAAGHDHVRERVHQLGHQAPDGGSDAGTDGGTDGGADPGTDAAGDATADTDPIELPNTAAKAKDSGCSAAGSSIDLSWLLTAPALLALVRRRRQASNKSGK
jgi:uncharacterized protein (TIGR03382 family)